MQIIANIDARKIIRLDDLEATLHDINHHAISLTQLLCFCLPLYLSISLCLLTPNVFTSSLSVHLYATPVFDVARPWKQPWTTR